MALKSRGDLFVCWNTGIGTRYTSSYLIVAPDKRAAKGIMERLYGDHRVDRVQTLLEYWGDYAKDLGVTSLKDPDAVMEMSDEIGNLTPNIIEALGQGWSMIEAGT